MLFDMLHDLLLNEIPLIDDTPRECPKHSTGKMMLIVTLASSDYSELVDAASDTYCMPNVFVQRLIRQELKRIRKEKENTDE